MPLRRICVCLLLAALSPLSARPVTEVPALAALFDAAGATGTFAVHDPTTATTYVHDAARARTRFIPASTFKIPHTLIALDSGELTSVEEVFPYDGQPRALPAWERAMSIRDAFTVSNVPVFQALARRLGPARLQAGVSKLNYGNAALGEVVDTFWLRGPLAISALEQITFLHHLATGDLPVSADAIRAVQDITRLETSPAFTLHGKTGWTTAPDPPIGWFVGWVETRGEFFPFALNLNMATTDQAPLRASLARACLRHLGILPPE